MRAQVLVLTVGASALFSPAQLGIGSAAAGEDLEFKVELRDGKVTPQRLEVPANARIILNVTNTGQTPAEFESKALRKEVVLAPGSTSKLVLKRLDAGEYEFFDDFHPDQSNSVVVAK